MIPGLQAWCAERREKPRPARLRLRIESLEPRTVLSAAAVSPSGDFLTTTWKAVTAVTVEQATLSTKSFDSIKTIREGTAQRTVGCQLSKSCIDGGPAPSKSVSDRTPVVPEHSPVVIAANVTRGLTGGGGTPDRLVISASRNPIPPTVAAAPVVVATSPPIVGSIVQVSISAFGPVQFGSWDFALVFGWRESRSQSRETPRLSNSQASDLWSLSWLQYSRPTSADSEVLGMTPGPDHRLPPLLSPPSGNLSVSDPGGWWSWDSTRIGAAPPVRVPTIDADPHHQGGWIELDSFHDSDLGTFQQLVPSAYDSRPGTPSEETPSHPAPSSGYAPSTGSLTQFPPGSSFSPESNATPRPSSLDAPRGDSVPLTSGAGASGPAAEQVPQSSKAKPAPQPSVDATAEAAWTVDASEGGWIALVAPEPSPAGGGQEAGPRVGVTVAELEHLGDETISITMDASVGLFQAFEMAVSAEEARAAGYAEPEWIMAPPILSQPAPVDGAIPSLSPSVEVLPPADAFSIPFTVVASAVIGLGLQRRPGWWRQHLERMLILRDKFFSQVVD